MTVTAMIAVTMTKMLGILKLTKVIAGSKKNMKKHNIQNASAFKTKQLGDKLNKVIEADIIRTEKHTWYCELIIAACVGASLTLAAVIAHMMITGPAWTW